MFDQIVKIITTQDNWLFVFALIPVAIQIKGLKTSKKCFEHILVEIATQISELHFTNRHRVFEKDVNAKCQPYLSKIVSAIDSIYERKYMLHKKAVSNSISKFYEATKNLQSSIQYLDGMDLDLAMVNYFNSYNDFIKERNKSPLILGGLLFILIVCL